MIAAIAIPYNAAAPPGYLIVEQRSGAIFDPVTGLWHDPGATPLTPATWTPLIVGPKATLAFASLTTWPIGNFARLWANVGDVIPGDQIVAIPFGFDPTGAPYPITGAWPVPLDLSAAGRIDADGWTMLAAKGIGVTAPTVPAGPLAMAQVQALMPTSTSTSTPTPTPTPTQAHS